MEYKIVTDGSCDLPRTLTDSLGVSVVPFYVSFDGEHYKKEIEEVGIRDFYEQMVSHPGVYPKSSMPTAPDFAAAFEPIAAAGEAIICICITTKFSGSMQSAMLAKDMILDRHPDAKITVIDAQINTVLQGIYVLEAVRLKAAGVAYDKAIERLLEIRASGRILFTVGSLDYLQHGGRIGKVAGKVATLLNVKPMITLKEGEIFSSGVARNRNGSMQKVIDMLRAYLKETGKPLAAYTLCIGYGYSYEEAIEFRKKLMDAMNIGEEEKVPLFQIGATIAVHTGPYPLGISILEKAL